MTEPTEGPLPLVLEARDLAIGYRLGPGRERVVLETPAFHLRPRELVCVLGPNGCGKTTLLRTLVGLLPPLRGGVLIDGTPVQTLERTERARQLAVVLTDRIDPGFLTVFELVALGRFPYTPWSGRLSGADREAVRAAIDALGLGALAERRISELSDGERQKVMIARAVAQRPKLLVLDEPTAFLDLPSRVEILQLLKRRVTDSGAAVVLSTHELDLALRLADRLWLIDRDGRFVLGAPEDLVLSGTVGQAFARPELEFEVETATFRPTRATRGRIQVIGAGAVALWTTRALERIGFEAQRTEYATEPRASSPVVAITTAPQQPGGTCWNLRYVDTHDDNRVLEQRYFTIDELTRELRHGGGAHR